MDSNQSCSSHIAGSAQVIGGAMTIEANRPTVVVGSTYASNQQQQQQQQVGAAYQTSAAASGNHVSSSYQQQHNASSSNTAHGTQISVGGNVSHSHANSHAVGYQQHASSANGSHAAYQSEHASSHAAGVAVGGSLSHSHSNSQGYSQQQQMQHAAGGVSGGKYTSSSSSSAAAGGKLAVGGSVHTHKDGYDSDSSSGSDGHHHGIDLDLDAHLGVGVHGRVEKRQQAQVQQGQFVGGSTSSQQVGGYTAAGAHKDATVSRYEQHSATSSSSSANRFEHQQQSAHSASRYEQHQVGAQVGAGRFEHSQSHASHSAASTNSGSQFHQASSASRYEQTQGKFQHNGHGVGQMTVTGRTEGQHISMYQDSSRSDQAHVSGSASSAVYGGSGTYSATGGGAVDNFAGTSQTTHYGGLVTAQGGSSAMFDGASSTQSRSIQLGTQEANVSARAIPSFARTGQHYIGPMLKFCGTDVQRGVSHYSLLVIKTPTTRLPLQVTTRVITPGFDHHNVTIGEAELLDTFAEHRFYRFLLTVPMAEHRTLTVRYVVVGCGEADFNVPAMNENFRFAFFSCNGYSSDVTVQEQKEWGGLTLWTDVLREAKKNQFHGMVGGGDQLYCDDIWEVPAIKEWLTRNDSKQEKANAPFTSKMNSQAHAFYFSNYLNHYTKAGFKEALAMLPAVSVWDDHDIMDGFGSYPAYLQNSPMFKGLFTAAQRFYLLFQQHTNLRLARNSDSPIDGYIGNSRASPVTSHSQLRQLGTLSTLVMLDTRTERSLQRIMTVDSWRMVAHNILRHLDANPQVRHLIVCATVPMIYPRMDIESLVSVAGTIASGVGHVANAIGAGAIWDAFGKTGAMKTVLNQLGEPELLDDLSDHWTSPAHVAERDAILDFLQEVAHTHRVRVTLLSGDVHCAAVGELRARNDPTNVPTLRKPAVTIQITSSAIVNKPPPGLVIRTLHKSGKDVRAVGGNESGIVERMRQDVFATDVDGKKREHPTAIGARNWCAVAPPVVNGVRDEEKLKFEIRVERVKGAADAATRSYGVTIPPVAKDGPIEQRPGDFAVSDFSYPTRRHRRAVEEPTTRHIYRAQGQTAEEVLGGAVADAAEVGNI